MELTFYSVISSYGSDKNVNFPEQLQSSCELPMGWTFYFRSSADWNWIRRILFFPPANRKSCFLANCAPKGVWAKWIMFAPCFLASLMYNVTSLPLPLPLCFLKSVIFVLIIWFFFHHVSAIPLISSFTSGPVVNVLILLPKFLASVHKYFGCFSTSLSHLLAGLDSLSTSSSCLLLS